MTSGASSDGSRAIAVVVGLDCITGLQTARILRARGITVVGVAAEAGHFATRTRACSRVIVSSTSGSDLIETLRTLGAELRVPGVLFPCSDAAVHTISLRRAEIDSLFRIRLPEHAVVHTLMDKNAFQAFATQHRLPIPRSMTVRSATDLARAQSQLTFPVVVKPALKTPFWQSRTKAKAFEVESAEELDALYVKIASWSESLIVQEWVVGGEDALYSCNAYFGSDGEPLATFIARKLRQWPPRTGTSSCGEECRNDAVLDTALELFRAAGFTGLAYVEMKRDERTGNHFIIEPNIGRPTGRSAIAEAGGVALLGTAYADAAGEPLPLNRHQRYGRAKWIYLRHDLQAAHDARKHGRLTWREWFRSVRGQRVFAVWSLRDPAPFLLDFVRAARKLIRRGNGNGLLAADAPPVPAALETGHSAASSGVVSQKS